MMKNDTATLCIKLIDELALKHTLAYEDYVFLLGNYNCKTAEYAARLACEEKNRIYKHDVFIRGLIEISNLCKNDCYYCGIRRSNNSCERYRLTKADILESCENGYSLGFRTFVLQAGEDSYFTDNVMCDIVRSISEKYPDCAITLSLGERSRESYEALYNAGASRYLLRHETYDKEHYERLHPAKQSFERRIECLKNLKDIGYQVGCGFMVGSPYQSDKTIAKDLKFIEEFEPDMCGIGPFIPHHATPFADYAQGDVDKTLFLLSLIRLIKPNILLPATTALGTADNNGREKGILAGANVIMPNLTPSVQRIKYELYDNKLCTHEEAAENIKQLKKSIDKIGYKIVTSKGDIRKDYQNGKLQP